VHGLSSPLAKSQPKPKACRIKDYITKEKVYITFFNFHKNPLFLLELQDQTKHHPTGFEGGFFYLFILVESFKNHSKSEKNHKIKKKILLDFT
jgi:hypothetical protein